MPDIQEYSVSIKFKTEGSDSAEQKIAELEKKIDKLSSSKNKISGLFKGFVGAKILGDVSKKIFNLSKQTSDYIETVNLFRASMGDVADEATNFINKAESNLGLDPKAMMDSISSFQNLSEAIGISTDRAYIMSKNLTQLSGDLSSFANISFEEAQRKLLSGFSGQVQPLRKYGIALDQASLQETAYSLGLQQKVRDMTRAQKTELIYYQMMRSTQKMQGDLGRSLLSPANAIRVMQQEFKALARAVGSIFIPIMMKIIPVVRAVTQILTEAAKAVASFFGFELGSFNSDLSTVGNLLSGVSDGIGDIGSGAEDTAKKMNKMLMPFDELNNITTSTGTDAGAGAGAGIGGGDLGIELPEYDMFESVTKTSQEQIEKIKAKIKELLPVIETVGIALGSIFIAKKVSGFIEVLSQLGKMLGGTSSSFKIIAGILLTIGGAIEYIKGVFDILNPNISYTEGLLRTLGGTALMVAGVFLMFGGVPALIVGIVAGIGILAATIYRFRDQIGEFFTKKVPEFFEGVGKRLSELPNQIGYWLGFALGKISKFVSQDIPQAVNRFFTETIPRWGEEIGKFFTETIPQKWEELVIWFEELPEKTLEMGRQIIEGLLNGLVEKWEEIKKKISEFVEGFINGFKEGLGIHSPSTVFADIGKNVIEGLWNGLKETWDKIKTKIENVYNWIQDRLVKPITTAFENFRNTLGTIWETISTKIQEKVEGIKNGITIKFQTAYDNIKRVFEHIGGFFSGIWETVKTTFSNLGTRISDAMSGSVKAGLNGVFSKIESIVNGFIRTINNAIGLINKIPNVSIPTLSPIYIPRLATGGMVDEGQLFIANEAGPELVGNIGTKTAVANRDQITNAISTATYNAMKKALAENGSSRNPQMIQVYVGDKKIYSGYGTYKDEESNMLGVSL